MWPRQFFAYTAFEAGVTSRAEANQAVIKSKRPGSLDGLLDLLQDEIKFALYQ